MRRKFDTIDPIVVEPSSRHTAGVVARIVMQVPPGPSKKQPKCVWFHEARHSVCVQSLIHIIINKSQATRALTAKTRKNSNFGSKLIVTLDQISTYIGCIFWTLNPDLTMGA